MNYIEKILNNKKKIPLDKFIDLALYKKKLGYYENKKIFGKDGDFITSPIISSIFSEMLSIWITSYWIYLDKPKKINILELGPGNGLMIKEIINSIKKIKTFNADFSIFLHEKSDKLIKLQKKNLEGYTQVYWIRNIKTINNNPTIILANEFFDAFPIKQFFKKNKTWYEQFVIFAKNKKKNIIFHKNKINKNTIKKYSRFYNLNTSKVIEYPTKIELYVKDISELLRKNNGVFLMFDYGYFGSNGRDTLRAIKKHKIVNLKKEYMNCDITFDVNFSILKKIFLQNNIYNIGSVSQNFFLQRLGIIERAQQVIKNQNLVNNKNLILSINKLLNPKEMGNTFYALAFAKKICKFNLGFK